MHDQANFQSHRCASSLALPNEHQARGPRAIAVAALPVYKRRAAGTDSWHDNRTDASAAGAPPSQVVLSGPAPLAKEGHRSVIVGVLGLHCG